MFVTIVTDDVPCTNVTFTDITIDFNKSNNFYVIQSIKANRSTSIASPKIEYLQNFEKT